MIQRIFYDRFLELEGDRLVRYMDPLLAAGEPNLDQESTRQLLGDLGSFDEYHLTYALELGSLASPETFASILPAYLADPRVSVFCAALNGMDRLPDRCLSPELVAAVRGIVPPQEGRRKSIDDLAARLQRRLPSA